MLRSSSVLALTVVLNACAHGSTPEPPRSGPAQASAPVTASAPGEYAAPGDDAAPEAPPPAAAPYGGSAERSSGHDVAESRRAEVEASPSRPGLGTEWGETRTSRVTSAPFEREDDQPTTTLSLFYNDARGIQAMTRGAAPSVYATSGATTRHGWLNVRLLDSGGSPLPTYELGGRTYVEGDDGDRYVIEIQNRTAYRFEAVATVDGLDVMDGRPGSFSKRGYLVAPWATVEIEGFRRSLDDVATFRFGKVADSYAAKKGDDRNVGVIGVAFFAEEGTGSALLQREADRRHDADPFPGRFASPPR